MTSDDHISYRFILTGLAVLLTACGQVGSRPPNDATSQPAQPPLSPTSIVQTTTPTPADATRTPAEPDTPTRAAVSPAPTATEQPTATPVPSPSPVSPSPSPAPTPPTFPPSIALQAAFSGFQAPVYLAQPVTDVSGGSRLFVVEKPGRIRLIKDGNVQAAPFLDITDRVGSGGSEQGLLSVAFPADFASSRTFYVDYTDLDGNTVVARYRVDPQTPDQADPNSEQKLLHIQQPAANHNGGQLQFGPDGYLYIGMGDGGRAGDPWGNAQNPGVLLGKLLRIDVSGAESHTIPDGNPLLGQADAQPEIWAIGLRNPWRFSFDRATGDLYIADVGQNTYEEVDFQPTNSSGGENYGWNTMEGNHCYQPSSGCNTSGLVLPAAEYDHSQGCSITGGYVYRGTRYPELSGVYFFGDYCSGNLWGLRQEASSQWQTALLQNSGLSISSFGQDAAGELYVLDYGDGTIYRLVAATPASE
jgi:glucose/arabinose dehydrogenase